MGVDHILCWAGEKECFFGFLFSFLQKVIYIYISVFTLKIINWQPPSKVDADLMLFILKSSVDVQIVLQRFSSELALF